jgi:hypothetical protein
MRPTAMDWPIRLTTPRIMIVLPSRLEPAIGEETTVSATTTYEQISQHDTHATEEAVGN